MFFEKFLLSLDNRALQKIFRELEWETIIYAIYYESDAVREKIYLNVSRRRANMIKNRIPDSPSIDATKKELSDEQRKIIAIGLHLQDTGELLIDKNISKEAHNLLKEAAAEDEKRHRILEEKTEDQKNDDITTLLIQRIETAINGDGKLDLSYFYFSPGIYYDDLNTADLEMAFDSLKKQSADLTRIKELTISVTLLEATDPLFKAGSLEELSIHGVSDFGSTKHNTVLSETILQCSRLKKLDIRYFGIKLPDWLQQFKSLVSLEIYSCEADGLTDWISGLDSLQELSISCNIESLPVTIGNLNQLTTFSLSSQKLKFLPESIGNLTNLTELYFSGSQKLKFLPDTIGNLTNLTRLGLYNNIKLKCLPDNIGRLSSLKDLNLSESGIEYLPETIGDLSSLETLTMDNTPVSSLPASFFNLTSLKSLILNHTRFKKIPSAIAKLPSLEKLELFGMPGDMEISPEIFSNKNIHISLDYYLILDKEPFLYEHYVSSYRRILATAYLWAEKSRREGLLALEEVLNSLVDSDFFQSALRLVVDGTDKEVINHILSNFIATEKDHYKIILKKMILEAALSIQEGKCPLQIVMTLNSMANIKKDPITDAIMDYIISGDESALEDILIKISEEEFTFKKKGEDTEIDRFIKQAMITSEISRREGLQALERLITRKSIKRDIFIYGISLVVDGYEYEFIEKILDNLVSHETEPAFRMLANTKKEAVLSIQSGDNPRILIMRLLSHYNRQIKSAEYYEN
jgi:Leucine-rich repeat (LRR) protein/flagellar motor component MotA